MCAPKPPKPKPPVQRAMAREPQRIAPKMTPTSETGSTRSTVVNTNPDMIRRAMTARLGGQSMVLGL